MKSTFVDEYEFLTQKIKELHELTVDTCEMCGGSYRENLDGATGYFILDGVRFKMTIEKAEGGK